MTIEGLENSTYYIYNPIWVKVSELAYTLKVDVTFNNQTFTFRLDPIDGVVEFDAAKTIRGILPSIVNKTTIPTAGVGIVDGVYSVRFSFHNGPNDEEKVTRYYMIGGKDEFQSNISPGVNLSLSQYHWLGWPKWISVYLNNKILNADDSVGFEWPVTKQLIPRHDCEHIFIAFRNLLGGFSFYLFEDFTFEKKNKAMGYYLIRKTIKDNGTETKVRLSVRTKAIRGLYETLEHLGQSEEIYYRLPDVNEYARLSGANPVKFNHKNNTTDVQFDFDVVTNATKSR